MQLYIYLWGREIKGLYDIIEWNNDKNGVVVLVVKYMIIMEVE